MSRHWMPRGLAAFVAFFTAGSTCTVSSSMENIPKSTHPDAIRATTSTLGGDTRYLTFISTDKPIYHAGEKSISGACC